MRYIGYPGRNIMAFLQQHLTTKTIYITQPFPPSSGSQLRICNNASGFRLENLHRLSCNSIEKEWKKSYFYTDEWRYEVGLNEDLFITMGLDNEKKSCYCRPIFNLMEPHILAASLFNTFQLVSSHSFISTSTVKSFLSSSICITMQKSIILIKVLILPWSFENFFISLAGHRMLIVYTCFLH